MNKLYIIGNACSDAETGETQSGIAYCRFNVAVNKNYGEDKKVTYFRIVAWRNQAETLGKYVKKGNKIAIVGEASLNEYEDGKGVKRANMEVTVSDFEFLTPKQADGEEKPTGKPKLEAFDSDSDSPF